MYDDDSLADGINPAKIVVVGVGGGGGNAVHRMISGGMKSAEFWVMNTDLQALKKSSANEDHKIQLGAALTSGLGAGGNPSVGERAAEENQDEISEVVKDADMVFITTGMGGGTGTGAAPVIAKIAKDSGALTIAVVTKPFKMEGRKKMKFADEGLAKLKECVDSIIVIPNERLLEVVDKRATLTDAFVMADEILKRGIQGISDIIALPGMMNVDFADIKAVMTNSGTAIMGIGVQSGEGRAVQAAEAAISSPLIESSIEGANGVIVNITGGADMTLHEVNAAAELIQDKISEDASFKIGAVINESMMNTSEIQITVIATGFDLQFNQAQAETVRKPLDVSAFFSGKTISSTIDSTPKTISGNGISGNGISGNGVSQKAPSGNGLSGNGMSGNGLSGNGLSGNGISSDGLSGNGLSGNGLSGNGMTGNGLSGNGLSGNGVPTGGLTGNGEVDLTRLDIPEFLQKPKS